MTFKPNTRDLETIATLGHARAPVAKICAALGIVAERLFEGHQETPDGDEVTAE